MRAEIIAVLCPRTSGCPAGPSAFQDVFGPYGISGETVETEQRMKKSQQLTLMLESSH